MNSIEKNHLIFIPFLFLSVVGLIFLFYSNNTFADSLISTNEKTKKEVRQKMDKTINSKSKPQLIEKTETYKIKKGDTFADAIESLGLEYQDMLSIVSSTKDVYDFTNIKTGQPLSYFKKDSKFDRLEYKINTDKKVIVQKNKNGEYSAKKEKIEYDITTTTLKGTISSSFFKAGRDVGMSDELIMDLAKIFAWNVDFATQVKQGDSFKILYKKNTKMVNL